MSGEWLRDVKQVLRSRSPEVASSQLKPPTVPPPTTASASTSSKPLDADGKRLCVACQGILDVLAADSSSVVLLDAYSKLWQAVADRDVLVAKAASREELEDVVELVQLTADAVERKLWDTVGDCLTLARHHPQALRNAVEVLKLADAASRRVFSGGLSELGVSSDDVKSDDVKRPAESLLSLVRRTSGGTRSPIPTAVRPPFLRAHCKRNDFLSARIVRNADLSMRQRFVEVLEWSAVRDFEALLTLLSRGGGTYSNADQVLESLNRLVERLALTRQLPPSFDSFMEDRSVQLLFETSTRKLVQMALHFYCMTSSARLTQQDILKLVRWLDSYKTDLRTHYPASSSANSLDGSATACKTTVTTITALTSDEEFCVRTTDELMLTFAVVVRGVMRNLAHTIFTQDISDLPLFNDQQQPVSHTPVDLFQIIHTQLDFVLKQTGRRCTPALYDALADLVCDVVGTFQVRQLAFLQRQELENGSLLLGEHKTPKDEVYLSAVINAATQSIDHVRDIETSLTADLSRTRRTLPQRRPYGTPPATSRDTETKAWTDADRGDQTHGMPSRTSRDTETKTRSDADRGDRTYGMPSGTSRDTATKARSDAYRGDRTYGMPSGTSRDTATKARSDADRGDWTHGVPSGTSRDTETKTRSAADRGDNDDPTNDPTNDSPFDACCDRFVQTAIEACDLLVVIAAQTLPLSKLFGDGWLSGRDQVMADTLATVEDFIKDFATWIMRHAYLGYIVKGCLRTLCAEYVRLFAVARRPVTPEVLARVKADVAAIRAYFERFAVAGADNKQSLPTPVLVAATVDTEMRPLLLIESFATSMDADFLQVHLPLIQLTFGTKSQTILEGLLAMTPDLSKQQRTALLKQLNEPKDAECNVKKKP